MKLACLGNKRKTHSACLRNKRKKQDAGKIACLRYKRKKRTEKQGKRGEYVCEIKGKKHVRVGNELNPMRDGYMRSGMIRPCISFSSY